MPVRPFRGTTAATNSAARLMRDSLVARIVQASLGLINIVAVTRVVGAERFGVYATATGFAYLLALLTDLGSTTVVVREGVVPGGRAAAARTYLHVRVLLIAGSTALGALVVLLVFPAGTRAAGCIALLLIVFAGPNLIAPLGQLFGSLRWYRTSLIVQSATGVTLTVLLVIAKPNATPEELVLVSVAAAVVGTVLAGGYVARHVPDVFARVDVAAVRRMAVAISVAGAGVALAAAYARIDGVLVLRLAGPEEAGLYAAAYRFLDQTMMVPPAILAPLGPMLAVAVRTHGRVPAALGRQSARIAAAGGVTMCLGAVAVAPWAVSGLLGEGFDESARLLVVLALSKVWTVLTFVAVATLIHAHRERRYIAVAALCLVGNITLNLVLIPAYGAQGAAWATVLTELAAVVGLMASVRPLSEQRSVRLPLLATVVGGAAVALMLAVGTQPDVGTAFATAIVGIGATWALGHAYQQVKLLSQQREPAPPTAWSDAFG